MSEWELSPYPDRFDCAFTIVHDADDAYSARLAPLYDAFDEYGIKTTVTAFAFWDQSNNEAKFATQVQRDPIREPKCVPLEHAPEGEFYRSLVERGHEVGLHTASDTHDLRGTVERAFEYYRSMFGFYPPVYVEHRDNLQNQQNCGSDPSSPYYVTDILNRYESWVWIVSPSAIPYDGIGRYYDVLSSQRPIAGYRWARGWGALKGFIKTKKWSKKNGIFYELLRRGGSPFDLYARERFGLTKAFRRSGRQDGADGEGFVEWYQDSHLDSLVECGGISLVYTHLNTKWCDVDSLKIRTPIENRLKAIASRNIWLATASAILDRYSLIDDLVLVVDKGWVKIINPSSNVVTDLTLISKRNKNVLLGQQVLHCNERGKILVGDVPARGSVDLKIVD